MRHDKRIPGRWVLPVLILAVLAAVLWAAVPGGREGPPGTLPAQSRPADPDRTVPPSGAPEQTVPPGTVPDETAQTTPEQPGPEQLSGQEPPADPKPTQTPATVLSGPDDIVCREIARFSGQYVEDGRDEPVENVAAILVKNKSDEFLDLATLTYDVDGHEAVFIVTGLPPGRCAWVMEASRLVIPDDAEFTYLDCMTSFREDVRVQTREVSVYADGNMLTAVNNTEETLEDVFVYYKTVHTDGNFFGGITYRVDFGTLEPGASAQVLAGHYSEASEIVRIGWVER